MIVGVDMFYDLGDHWRVKAGCPGVTGFSLWYSSLLIDDVQDSGIPKILLYTDIYHAIVISSFDAIEVADICYNKVYIYNLRRVASSISSSSRPLPPQTTS